MVSAIQFSGLASGLDTNAIINALMGVERIPLARMEAQNADFRSQMSIIDKLSSSLSSMKTAVDALATTEEFMSFSGTLSDDDAAEISVSGDAAPGTYAIDITTLAASQRSYSNTFADKSAALDGASDQTLTLSINGTDTAITVPSGATLDDVVSLVNSSDAKVTAGLFYDGTQYRLQIVGKETGVANKITFSDTGLGLGFDADDVGKTPQKAVDAAFSVDGFAVTSSQNNIEELLPGVSMTLSEVTSSPITLEIAPDTDAIKKKLKAVVDSYNSAMKIINDQSGEGKGTNTLNGDSTVRAVQQQMMALISGTIPGLQDSTGYDLSLAQLGFETQRDGTLSLNDSDLDKLLATDFASAARFFTGDSSAGIEGMSTLMSDLIEGFVDGSDSLLEIRKDGISRTIDNNVDRISAKQIYLDAYEESLREQYIKLETTMSALQSQQAYLAQFL